MLSIWKKKPEKPERYRWSHADVAAMAREGCHQCHGEGMRHLRFGKDAPCYCVFREVFRACYTKYREIGMAERISCGGVTLERAFAGATHKFRYGRRREEFRADFYLVSRRFLEPQQWPIFELHYLAGCDWRECCQALHMDRGTFWHEVYKIQHRLGRAFQELQPYALWPLDEYFSVVTGETPVIHSVRSHARSHGLFVPLRTTAEPLHAAA